MKKLWYLAASALLALPLHMAHAQDVVVAHVGPMSGPLAGNGIANYEGAKAYFDQVNAQGGINGQKIRLVREDDQYKADETIRLVQEVAKRDRPAAFINLLGSANVTAMFKDKTLDKVATPFVGITPGAEALRNPGSPWMFHVQAGDRAQLRRVLTHLSTIGLNKIAVVYQDIPFGKSGLGFVDEMAPGLKVEIAARIAAPSASEDFKAVAQQLKAANAKTYLMILTPNSGAAMVRDLRAAGDRTPIYSMSYVPASAILEKAPLKDAVGIALAQVTPNPDVPHTPLSRDFPRRDGQVPARGEGALVDADDRLRQRPCHRRGHPPRWPQPHGRQGGRRAAPAARRSGRLPGRLPGQRQERRCRVRRHRRGRQPRQADVLI